MIYPEMANLPLFDLKYNKVREAITHRIEFNRFHLVWILHCYLDVLPKPDDDFYAPKENEYYHSVDFIRKDKIISIESYFCNTYELWVLCIYFGDRNNDCKFETENEMRAVEAKLHEWMTID